jgi:two-component system sensor kinase FixL
MKQVGSSPRRSRSKKPTQAVPGRTGARLAQAEQSGRETAERLRAILQTAVEGIITIDERGIIESLNPAAERIFGYSAAELIGRNVSVLMPAPYRQEHDTYLANYRRTGHARIIGIGREVVGQRKNGSVFPMDLSVSEIQLHNRRLFTGFVRDITERKRLELEILEISNRERRRLGQDLHDGLGQELAGIQLMAEVLEQNLKKSKRDAVQAGKIAEHVRQAITHTRMLARGLSPVELEANGLMSALQELTRHTEALFQISCRFECASPVLVRDNAAATHLFRIAQESVNNAVKHSGASHITVELRLDGQSGHLRIRDDGAGFRQPAPDHSGIGLRIMKYRADVIGAAFEIKNAPGGGTLVTSTFSARL